MHEFFQMMTKMDRSLSCRLEPGAGGNNKPVSLEALNNLSSGSLVRCYEKSVLFKKARKLIQKSFKLT